MRNLPMLPGVDPTRTTKLASAGPTSTTSEGLGSYHHNALISRDLGGKVFAFQPLLCRLYSLEEHELYPGSLNENDHFVVDVGQFPLIEKDLMEEVAIYGVKKLHRRHTPGIALIVTQTCNLTCSYCLAKQGTFGVEVGNMKFTEVSHRLTSLFESNPDIDFIKFFGGEPTLRIDLIEQVCGFVENELGKRTHFALTTNGTMPAQQHLELWKRYHISVSVSVDGPPEIHDAVRVRSDGRGSHRQAIEYCERLRSAGFPFAAVGVFDARHISKGMSYLDMIRYLNKISPLAKVQFVEALGGAVDQAIPSFNIQMARRQTSEAVDAIMNHITSDFCDPGKSCWVYDNNLYRFLYGIVLGVARPYEHACTASNLTTLFPSGEVNACYTFAEHSALRYGGLGTSSAEIESRRAEFRNDHTWEFIASQGNRVPWYRGIVGDICVADMMNSGQGGLEQSPFYRAFQEAAALRILQWLPIVAQDPLKTARVLHAIEQHKIITGEYTAKMKRFHA